MFATVSELRIDDKVIALSSNPDEIGKTFIVTDLHPVHLRATRSKPEEYVTVAVSLWQIVENHYGPGQHQYGREHVSRTTMFQIIERRWQ